MATYLLFHNTITNVLNIKYRFRSFILLSTMIAKAFHTVICEIYFRNIIIICHPSPSDYLFGTFASQQGYTFAFHTESTSASNQNFVL